MIGKRKEGTIWMKNMDKLYLDTNVILDYLQNRLNANFIERIFLEAHKKKVRLITSVLNFATIYYIEKRRGHRTKDIFNRFILLNKIITPVDQTTQSYSSALKSDFADFEDALQYFAAIENNSDFIITNNKKDFKRSAVPILTAKEYIARRS